MADGELSPGDANDHLQALLPDPDPNTRAHGDPVDSSVNLDTPRNDPQRASQGAGQRQGVLRTEIGGTIHNHNQSIEAMTDPHQGTGKIREPLDDTAGSLGQDQNGESGGPSGRVHHTEVDYRSPDGDHNIDQPGDGGGDGPEPHLGHGDVLEDLAPLGDTTTTTTAQPDVDEVVVVVSPRGARSSRTSP